MSRWHRFWAWLDERLGWSTSILPIIEHPVPRNVNWWYVLGSATLVAFIVQVVTGVALAFAYVPAPNSAYSSLNWITHDEVLGHVVRGIHYWGASAMVILIFAHVIRVFLFGSYKFPRELNWLTGVFLLFLTLGMAFTGQLLRWDQDAYWAVAVGGEMAGRTPFIGKELSHILFAGQTIGGPTLTRFYATHVFLLPALMFLLIGAHLYLVVRHGISDPPEAGVVVDTKTERKRYHDLIAREGIPFWPDAAWRDVIFALAVGSVVLILAVFVGPKELGKLADPTIIKANPRPDWYFLWYFALLALMPPAIENYFIIGFPLLVAIVFLILPFIAPTGERSWKRRPWAVGIVVVSLVSIAVLVREGQVAPWSPNFNPKPIPAQITQPLTGDATRGAQLFSDSGCHNCHTIDGTGGSRGPNLTTVGNRLSVNELTWRILNGGTNMPAFADTLSPSDVHALVDFLSSLKGSSGSTAKGP
ncbi:MAG TPA: cytochrome b N-terminal domain-containing protein [Thermomicrobiaceae bacterium]|nr:cytochrome b N-terminal domain-containing protein [Thermomicrobiaceae bacterium]